MLPVTRAADYIAVTKGTRTYPWRVLGIVDRDTDLLTNQIVYLLEKPSQVADTSVDQARAKCRGIGGTTPICTAWTSRPASTPRPINIHVDFAAKYAIPYIILDAGWYKAGNCLEVVPEIKHGGIDRVCKAKKRGPSFLWLAWKTLDDQLELLWINTPSGGIKGIKVDFMQRSDQLLINYYHKVSRETAKRKMLVDFHGDQKPATMTRTWPNLISTEGVRGMEWDKWSAETDPKHNTVLPFTRMFLGRWITRPARCSNAQKSSFAAIYNRPMSLGTTVPAAGPVCHL